MYRGDEDDLAAFQAEVAAIEAMNAGTYTIHTQAHTPTHGA